MAKGVIKKATILLHNLDVSGLHNNIDPTINIAEVQCTNYASNGWEEYLPGLKSTEIPVEGYLEADTIEAEQFDSIENGTIWPFGYGLTRPLAAGDVFFFTHAWVRQWTRRQQIGEVYGYNGQLQRNAPMIRGRVLENLTGASSGNGTAYDLGSAIPDGERLWVAVWVTGVSDPGDTLDLDLESDADTGMASPTSRLVIPTITGLGSYFGYVDGPVTDEAWRLVRTITGSVTYVAAIGRAPIN